MMMRNILVLFALLLITGSLAGNVVYAMNPMLKTQDTGLIETAHNKTVKIEYNVVEHWFTHNVDYMTVWFTKKDSDDTSKYLCCASIWDKKSGERLTKTVLLSNLSYSIAITLYAGDNWDINDFQHNISYYK